MLQCIIYGFCLWVPYLMQCCQGVTSRHGSSLASTHVCMAPNHNLHCPCQEAQRPGRIWNFTRTACSTQSKIVQLSPFFQLKIVASSNVSQRQSVVAYDVHVCMQAAITYSRICCNTHCLAASRYIANTSFP